MVNSRHRTIRVDADGLLVIYAGAVFRPWPSGLHYNPLDTANITTDVTRSGDSMLDVGVRVEVAEVGDGTMYVGRRRERAELWVLDRILRSRPEHYHDRIVFEGAPARLSAGEVATLRAARQLLDQLGRPAIANQVSQVLRTHS